jgi:hypothetical protein
MAEADPRLKDDVIQSACGIAIACGNDEVFGPSYADQCLDQVGNGYAVASLPGPCLLMLLVVDVS